MWVEAEQNGAVSLLKVVLHIRHVPSLRGDSIKLCLRGRLLGVCLKPFNIPHQLGMRRKAPQCPTSVRNGKSYEYLSIDNIQQV